MKMLMRVVAIITPVAAMFAIIFYEQYWGSYIPGKWVIASCFAVIGIAGAVGIHSLNSYLSGKTQVPCPLVGSLKKLLLGILLGLATSMVSGLLYYAVYKPEISHNLPVIFKQNLPLAATSNISSAVIEEAAFRGGLVHFIAAYWGQTAGLLGGSIPFGLAHLAGRIWGIPVDLLHVIGTAMAGLLLSLVYLRWGLLSAIGLHWTWNSLCLVWVRSFCLGQNGAIVFEGSITTTSVLVMISLALLFCCKREISEKRHFKSDIIQSVPG